MEDHFRAHHQSDGGAHEHGGRGGIMGRRGGGGPGGTTGTNNQSADNQNQNRRNRGGGGGGFGQTEPDPAAEALQKAIEAKAPSEEIKAKLAAYRASRKDKQAKLEKLQDELRQVLSLRQEGLAVSDWLVAINDLMIRIIHQLPAGELARGKAERS